MSWALFWLVSFAVAFLGERTVAREWMGLGLVAAGVLLLSLRR